MKHHKKTWFSTYLVFILNLSTRINKQFNHIGVATVRSIVKSCPTFLYIYEETFFSENSYVIKVKRERAQERERERERESVCVCVCVGGGGG